MKIVFFTTYYLPYLESFYRSNPGLTQLSYKEQLSTLLSDHFGVFGAYTHYAQKAGHDSDSIVCNCEPLQRTWANENNVPFDKNWQFSVVLEQIKMLKPDVFFISSVFHYYGDFLRAIKPYCKKIVGWVASPIPQNTDFTQFSMIFSSAPHYVDDFRKMGCMSELLSAGFDPRILEKVKAIKEENDFSFIGGMSTFHKERVALLKKIAARSPLQIWGYGYKKESNWIKRILEPDPIEKCYRGDVWGMEMYALIKRSKIVLNIHIPESQDYAGNMRMYETTGMGSFLLTDKKKNSARFKPGLEVVEYDSAADAVEKVRYYLEHDDERKKIAQAGQTRTLAEYSYAAVVTSIMNHLENILKT